MFSGGIGSWAAAKRVAEQYGTENLYLLFADTLIEDEDLYRFLDEASANVGGKFVRLAEGRDPWTIFKDVRFLGNSRIDPCSQILKRHLCDKWLNENFKPEECQIYIGIDWTESHRYERMKDRKLPWVYKAPLCEEPYLTKQNLFDMLKEEGIKPPRLYEMGFPHNNCGGFCVKAGKNHFKLLLEKLPERFKYHEQKEQELREYLGKDVSIMREQRNKKKYNLTMKQLRERVEEDSKAFKDEHEWGGCGCFSDVDEEGK